MILVLIFIAVLTVVAFSAWMVLIDLVKLAFSAVGLAFALIRCAIVFAQTAVQPFNRRHKAMETNP